MSERIVTGEIDGEEERLPRKKYPRHPISMENTPEETIKRMESFPERATKLKERMLEALPERAARFMELIRFLGEADTR